MPVFVPLSALLLLSRKSSVNLFHIHVSVLLPLLLSLIHLFELYVLCYFFVLLVFIFSALLLLTHYGQPALTSKFAFLVVRHGV